MCFFFFFILFLGTVLTVFGSIFLAILWCVHRDVTIDECPACWGYATFPAFLQEFYKRKWVYNRRYKHSLISEAGEKDGYIHNGFVKFSDHGMILYPWSFVRFFFWKLKHLSDLGHNRELWK